MGLAATRAPPGSLSGGAGPARGPGARARHRTSPAAPRRAARGARRADPGRSCDARWPCTWLGFDGPRLLITHDPTEAFLLADEIHVIEDGTVTQCGTADEIRRRPRTAYIADLSGSNLVIGTRGGRRSSTPGRIGCTSPTTLPRDPYSPSSGHRPSPSTPAGPEGSPRNAWATRVELVEHLGRSRSPANAAPRFRSRLRSPRSRQRPWPCPTGRRSGSRSRRPRSRRAVPGARSRGAGPRSVEVRRHDLAHERRRVRATGPERDVQQHRGHADGRRVGGGEAGEPGVRIGARRSRPCPTCRPPGCRSRRTRRWPYRRTAW